MKLDSIITVEKSELTRDEWEALLHKLTYVDSDEIEIQAYELRNTVVRLPRGTLDMLPSRLTVSDLRSRPLMPKVAYTKELDAEGYEGQSGAVAAMFEHEQGQVIAPPGRGKTEMVLAFAASARTRTLVIVHTNALFKQWVDRAAVSVPGMSVGKIQGQTFQVEHLTIATAQTLKRYLREGGAFWRQFGAVIVDEAHHAAAETWEWVLNTCPAFYRFGVTASEKRSDGRHPSVRFNIGPVIYKLRFESGVPMTVIPVESKFRTTTTSQRWAYMMREVIHNVERNAKIAQIVNKEIKAGNSVLVLSRQIKHLENIAQALAMTDRGLGNDTQIVTGKLSRVKQAKTIKDLKEGNISCILGTQMFEEGVDIPNLNRIVLAYPGTEITVLQKVGRGARQAEGKTETIVYDIVDDLVTGLARQWSNRKAWYKANGIQIGKVMRYDKPKKGKAAIRLKGAEFLKSLKVTRQSEVGNR